MEEERIRLENGGTVQYCIAASLAPSLAPLRLQIAATVQKDGGKKKKLAVGESVPGPV
jgi:hypothetical protein